MVEPCLHEKEMKEMPWVCLRCERRKALQFLLDQHEDREIILFMEGFEYALSQVSDIKFNKSQKALLKAIEIKLFCDVIRGLKVKDFEKEVVNVESDEVWYRV